MKVHAFASAQYIRRHGAPQTLEALDEHAIVSYSGTPAPHLSRHPLAGDGRHRRPRAAQAGLLPPTAWWP